MSFVICWKDTNWGTVVDDKFRKISLASSCSLKTSIQRSFIHAYQRRNQKFRPEEHSLYFDQVAVVQFVVRSEIDHRHSLIVIVNGCDLVSVVRVCPQSDAIQPFERILEESWLLNAARHDCHDQKERPARGDHVCPLIGAALRIYYPARVILLITSLGFSCRKLLSSMRRSKEGKIETGKHVVHRQLCVRLHLGYKWN